MGSEKYLKQVTVGEVTELNGRILLKEYDPKWPELFERERDRIRKALGMKALAVEHVGSTAVFGLCAKPIIDILLLVENPADERAFVPLLEKAGYELRIREPEWHQHRMFRGHDPEVNLHVFSAECREADRMLAFRDRLRSDAADRERYGAVKRRLAAGNWKYVQDYADAKSEIVTEIMERALPDGEWENSRFFRKKT